MGGTTRILFRADSGLEIGTGHVMRCLTLADSVLSQGAEAVFVTREHRGHVIPSITDRGHRALVQPGNTGQPYGDHPAPPAHALWLEADWREDAAATRAALEETGARWLVVDHYALDAQWQDAALKPGVALLVLDDLADRSHRADVLLDQNAGREAQDYAGLVPEGCDLRIGPAHALLRPEFARLRPEALARRKALARPGTLLITLGGIDKDNATGAVLEALTQTPAAQGLRITVVMGGSAPHLDAVRARAAAMPMPTEVVAGVSDMAQRMMRADLCIGAAGSTAWERCALGLPTLQVVLADNQRAGTRALVDSKAALCIGSILEAGWQDRLALKLQDALATLDLKQMSRAAARLTDGRGTEALALRMLELSPITFRPAGSEDARFIFECREAGDAWCFYRSAKPSVWENHLKWFGAAQTDPRYILLIAEDRGVPVAHVRLDKEEKAGQYHLSIYIGSQNRGRGLGSRVLRGAIKFATEKGWTSLSAEVHEANAPSLRIFDRCGFERVGKTDSFLRFLRRLDQDRVQI